MGDIEETTPFLLILLLVLVFLLGWCGDWLSSWETVHSAPVQENLAQAAPVPPVVARPEAPRVTVGNFAYDNMVSHYFTDVQTVPTHRKD